MHRVHLIHWNEAEALERAAAIDELGFAVSSGFPGEGARGLATAPPDVFVIDLSRIPSQGRDLGVFLRQRKATRSVPLVFVGGVAEKAERVRELLPDAVFTQWSDMGAALERALRDPPAEPIVPGGMAAYAGAPLAKKLGIKGGSTVALVGAPEGFEHRIEGLPEGARLVKEPPAVGDLTLWFVRSQSELEDGIERMGRFAKGGGLWIIWPKQSSGVSTDVTQITVRRVGLHSGLVDFKISRIDDTWSGLRFTQRDRESA